MSFNTFKKLNLEKLDSSHIPHVVGASGESLGTLGKTICEIQINNTTFTQTFIVCEHLKRPLILGRDFSIQNHMGISWTKHNTRQLTQYNEVIAETKEYQPTSRAAVSLKNNVKVPPRSCAVVDVDVNTSEQIKVEIQPDELWLNSNPNICTYPLIADLREKKDGDTTPFITSPPLPLFTKHSIVYTPPHTASKFTNSYYSFYYSIHQRHYGRTLHCRQALPQFYPSIQQRNTGICSHINITIITIIPGQDRICTLYGK